jgi:hypothetical protein
LGELVEPVEPTQARHHRRPRPHLAPNALLAPARADAAEPITSEHPRRLVARMAEKLKPSTVRTDFGVLKAIFTARRKPT